MPKKPRPIFLLALLLCGLLLPPSLGLSATAPLSVSVIDVGQGDSILVEFPNGQDMLVDAGPRVAGSTVVNYLHNRHLQRIDILVASHPHEDHIGGMEAVLAAFPVGKVWDSGYIHGSRTQQNFYAAIKSKGIRFGKPRAGFSEMIGDAKIDVLAPGTHLLSGTDSDANNNSLVLRITYGDISFLLPGDMEGAERATVTHWPKTTVLKVAHHGSRNGTNQAFAQAISPSIAVISCGLGNSYGHPHYEVLQALSTVGAKVLQTAQVGNVVLTTDGKTLSYSTQAKTLLPYIPQAAQSKSSSVSQTGYIGNRNSHIFHLPSCSSLPAEKNRVYFDSREAAIAAGYRPCKRCKP